MFNPFVLVVFVFIGVFIKEPQLEQEHYYLSQFMWWAIES